MEFGQARMIVVAHVEGLTREAQNAQRLRLRKIGFECLGVTAPNDARTVFRELGFHNLANCVNRDETILCFSYGNELSPIGNPETLPFIRQMLGEFHDNKKRPHDYVLGAVMDGREMPANEFLKILDVEKPKKQWESFFGCLTHYRSLPTYLTSHQVQLMRILEAHRKTLNGEELPS